MPEKRILAIDMGDSDGRAMLGLYNGSRIKLEAVHRFPVRPVDVRGRLCHDVLRFYEEIKTGIGLAHKAGGFSSMGIDGWGCDFGLIDRDGQLLFNPFSCRDERSTGAMEDFFSENSPSELYGLTGLPHLRYNTVFQLFAMRDRPEIFAAADKFLMMPDLLTYFLTGSKKSEFTVSSTTQMLNPYSKNWNGEVLAKIGIDPGLLCEVVPSGTHAGMLSREICNELNIRPADVMYTAGHATAAAFAAAPAGENSVYISSGTRATMGARTKEPIINEAGRKYSFANEGACDGSFSFLKNISGLRLLQECRREWGDPPYTRLAREAAEAEPFKCFIDPDDARFIPSGDMPGKIRAYCRAGGQYVPATRGEIARCIYESLAMRYREALGQLRAASGRIYTDICVVGDGSRLGMLSQFTADACGLLAADGPQDAAAGNIAAQLIAAGELKDLNEARDMIARSFAKKDHKPENTAGWTAAYDRFFMAIRKTS